MTNAELNRDVARLGRKVKNRKRTLDAQATPITNEQWKVLDAEEEEIRKEIRRLYRADDTFEVLSRKSILTLLRLNLTYRAIPLHNFGLMIKD